MVSLKLVSEFDQSKHIEVYHKRSDAVMVLRFMKSYGHSIDKILVQFYEGQSMIEEYTAEHFISDSFEFPKFLNDDLVKKIYEVLPSRMAEARFGDGAGKDEMEGELDEMSDHELYDTYCDYHGLYDMGDVENDEIAKKCQAAYDSFQANIILAKEIKGG